MKSPWIIIAALIVVLFGGAIWYSSEVNEQANQGVEITENVKGNPDAEVVLEEYSDFQCPACGQFYPVVKDIMEDYGDRLRFEYEHFPLTQIHPLALPAAQAAEAAGQQGKFFEYHDALFENQDKWAGNTGSVSAFFGEIAEDLELDMELFARHQRSSLIREKIQEDISEGIARGVNSTPTFFLNGERVELQSIGDLRTAVENALGVSGTADTESAAGTTTETVDEADDAPSTPAVRFSI